MRALIADTLLPRFLENILQIFIQILSLHSNNMRADVCEENFSLTFLSNLLCELRQKRGNMQTHKSLQSAHLVVRYSPYLWDVLRMEINNDCG